MTICAFPSLQGGENSSKHSNATTPAALHHEHSPCPDGMQYLVPALLSEFEEAYSLLNQCSTNDTVSFRIFQEIAKMQKYRRKHESRAIRAIPVPQQGRSTCTLTPSPLLVRSLLQQMHRRLTLLSIARYSGSPGPYPTRSLSASAFRPIYQP